MLIVADAHGLSITGRVGIDLLIRGILGVTVGETHLGLHHTLNLFEIVLGTIEAATDQVDLFYYFRIFNFDCSLFAREPHH